MLRNYLLITVNRFRLYLYLDRPDSSSLTLPLSNVLLSEKVLFKKIKNIFNAAVQVCLKVINNNIITQLICSVNSEDCG